MNLNTKTKIQLYILPILIAYLIFYFYESALIPKKDTLNSNVKFEEKKFRGNYIDLFYKVESFSKSENINILNISRDKNRLKLHIQSSLFKSAYLIDYLENLNAFTIIKKVNLNKINNNKDYFYEVEVSLNKYYKKELKKFQSFKEKDKKDFKVNAIVGDFVLIDNKLFKKGEKIGTYTILDIRRNYVELKNIDEVIKVELFNGKLAKKLY